MPRLKYEQIAESLRSRIADGEFGPGAVLPSSRDLCEQWAVSRATAIKAMEVLRSDGLVVPHQGRGFSVTQTPVARPAGGRGPGTTRAQGGPYRRLGVPEMLVPPSHVADALGLAAGRQALHRARLVLTQDGQPHSLVSAWFPPEVAELCPRLQQNGPIAEGTTRYVHRTTGWLSIRGVDTTSVRLATKSEAELFQVKRPCAVAVVLHTAYDDRDEALVCEEGVTPEGLWERMDNYAMNLGD